MARSKEVIGRTRLPGGQELKLTLEQGYYLLALDGIPLMSSAAHYSEEHLAEIGCEGLAGRKNTRVLVGGLGMGYTLRAALDRTAPTSTVVVAELSPAVVEWNRGPLADLADRPLEDPRTQVETRDIVAYLRSRPEPFDAILLDTDNSPSDFTAKGNSRLYDPPGLARIRDTLKPGGRLVIWSVSQVPSFKRDLQRARFEPSVVRAKSRGEKGGRHTLYVGRRPVKDARPAPSRPKPRAKGGRRKGRR